MNKYIYQLGKWALILYPVMVINFAISTQLFAQNVTVPKSEDRGSPKRTGGAGGRVKPEMPIPESGGENHIPLIHRGRDRFYYAPPRKYQRYQRPQILEFPLEENIKKQPLKLTSEKAGGSCVTPGKNKPFLTALIPPQAHLPKTSIDNTAFFVYLPKTTATVGDFVLFSDQNDEIYQQSIQLPSTPGIIKMSIPESVKLEDGKTYQWQFSVVCDSLDRSQDEYVGGQIQKLKLDPNFTKDLLQLTSLEKAKIYAESGIWYDTLIAISEIKKEYPLDWESLLTSVGLKELAKEPLNDCCTVNK